MRTEIFHTVTFGKHGNAHNYQAYGWHPPENGFTWMDGKESALVLPRFNAPHGFFVETEGFPCHPGPAAGHSLTIAANGCASPPLSPGSKGTYAGYFPALPQNDAALVLILHHPHTVIPGERDSRELSFACQRLRVAALLEPGGHATGRGSFALPRLDWTDHAAVAAHQTGLPLADFAMQFESLGDDCELGLVQRRWGAEPLGLFRFAEVFLPLVLRAVEEDFLGMGDRLQVAMEDAAREWMARELSYQMRWHTFIHGEDGSQDQMMERERKKLAFLIRKARADILEGAKIFTVKSRDNPASIDQIIPLHLALNRRTPNWLLWITLADASHPPGMVEEIQPRLMRGYIDRFCIRGVPNSQSLPGWLAVLTNAWLLRRQ